MNTLDTAPRAGAGPAFPGERVAAAASAAVHSRVDAERLDGLLEQLGRTLGADWCILETFPAAGSCGTPAPGSCGTPAPGSCGTPAPGRALHDGPVLRRAWGMDPQTAESLAAAGLGALVAATGRPVRLPDCRSDDPYGLAGRLGPSVNAVLCYPVLLEGEPAGAVTLGLPDPGALSGRRADAVRAILGLLGLACESARLRGELARHRRVDRDLESAARVQRALLPTEPPLVPGLDVAGACLPAAVVGGDYYDFLQVHEGWFGAVIGDVMGKGMSAALFAAAVKSIVRAEARRSTDTARVLGRVNRFLYEELAESETFLTLFFANLDLGRGVLHYTDAAHVKPFLLREGGGVERLQTDGMLLGAVRNARYERRRTPFGAGDSLVLVTDGVADAGAYKDDRFGEGRVLEILSGCHGAAAQDVVDRLVEAVTTHERRGRARDDITVVVLRREDPS